MGRCKLFLSQRVFYFFIVVFVYFSSCCQPLLAQNMPAQGMIEKKENYSSFSERIAQNIDFWKKINAKDYYEHPEFGILPPDAPCTACVEDLSKRTPDERYFVDISDPNKFYQQKAMGLLHENVNGQWLSIDHRLSNSSNSIYKSGYTLDRAGFDISQNRSFLETSLGNLSFNRWSLIVKRSDSESESIDANWSQVQVGEDGVFIQEIFPGIDAEMRVLRGAIKTSFIINNNNFGVFKELVFTDHFSDLDNINLEFASLNSQEAVGDVWVKKGGENLAFVQQGVLYAKNGPKNLVIDPVYRILQNKLGVVVPYFWINDNIGQYQLVVDPTVTGAQTLAQASILGSQYNASCNFTNSCNANLTVARPANATITDVQWTFNYTATGLCWREDGAVRFTTGGCVSPSQAGFYWFCNLPSAGTCTGTNISVFNDLGPCLPAPSCVPVNVNFTMQFFRSCWGSTGCNNTCIGAASPWTMTIIGKTLEYTNSTNNITLSGTTVCQGGTLTASTGGSFGVPGYTYNWSFSPTGTPSVGSGASAVITFPNSGTMTLYSIVTDACGNVINGSRTVTVTPGPVISANPNSPIICSGQNTGIALSSNVTNTTYTWTVVQTGVTGASNGNQTGNNVSINQTLTTTGNSSGTAVYTITPTSGGCAGTPIVITVTVNPPLVPNVTIAANTTAICDGQTVTFTATPINGGSNPTYQWLINGNPVAGQTSSTFSSSTLINGNSISVQMVSNATPCLSTTNVSSPPIVITVNPNIQASVTISASATTVCAGDPVTFTATPVNGGTSPVYDWYVDNVLIIGQNNSSFTTTTLTNGSVVTVQMTSNAAPCLVGSPALSNAISVTVNPTITPSVIISTPTSVVCQGSSVSFSTISTNGGSQPLYQWFINGNPVAGQTSATFVSSTLNDGDIVSVELTSNAAPCLVQSTVLSNTISMDVNPTLTASVSISATASTICAGSSVTFTANPLNGGTNPAYQWFLDGNPIVGQTSSTLTTNSLTNGAVISVEMLSNAAPCLIGSPATSNSIMMVVNPVPVVTASNNGPLCESQQLDLNATLIAGAIYSWTGPLTYSSALQNPSISSVTLANAGTYTVTVNLNGCFASSSTLVDIGTGTVATLTPVSPLCVNSPIITLIPSVGNGTWSGPGIVNTITGEFDPSQANVGVNSVVYTIPGACGGSSSLDILVLPIPIVSISSNLTSGCSPLNVTFVDNSSPASVSVSWDFGNGSTSTTTNSTTYDNPGCYDVTLTSTNAGGCSTTQVFSDFICVLEDPIADFTANNFTTSVFDPNFQFVNLSQNATDHSWHFGNGTTSSEFNPQISYDEVATSYNVQLIATNSAGCSDTVVKIVTVLDELLFFIPNSFTPNGDEFNNAFIPIFTSGFDPYAFSLKIFNRWGEIIFETKDPKVGWDGTYLGSIVPQGVYTWTLQMKDKRSDEKYQYSGHLNVLR